LIHSVSKLQLWRISLTEGILDANDSLPAPSYHLSKQSLCWILSPVVSSILENPLECIL
jgi:hypothetical protein